MAVLSLFHGYGYIKIDVRRVNFSIRANSQIRHHSRFIIIHSNSSACLCIVVRAARVSDDHSDSIISFCSVLIQFDVVFTF